MSNDYKFEEMHLDASTVIENCMSDYILDVSEKKLPHYIDGLKAIHRRILWVAKEYPDLLDTTTLVSDTLKIHTSGDASISDAVIRLNQPYNMGVNLLHVKGNRGNYNSVNGGADRYTRIKMSDIARELFINKVNMKTIPIKTNEKYTGVEPVYFIPRLPTTLLMHTLTIGAGIKSLVLPLNLSNVCDLVKYFIDYNHGKDIPSYHVDFRTVIDKFIPDFPIKNHIRNVNELEMNYINDNFNSTIIVDGYSDVTNTDISIKTAPFGYEFANVLQKIISELRASKQSPFGEPVELKNLTCKFDEANVTLSFRRNADTLKLFDKYRKIVKYTSAITPIYNFTDEHGYVHNYSPPTLIRKWYDERKKSIVAGIKYDLNSTSMSIISNKTRLLLNAHYDDIMGIIRDKSLEKEQIFNKLKDTYKLSTTQCKILTSVQIMEASKASNDELNNTIERLQEKSVKLAEDLHKVDEIIYQDADYFKNNFGKEYCRKTKINGYMGYVSTTSGTVQFDNLDEACTIISNFDADYCRVYAEGTSSVKIPYTQGRCKHDGNHPSKINTHSFIIDRFDENQHTLWIDGDNKILYTEGMLSTLNTIDNKYRYVPITRTFYGIENNGRVSKVDVSVLNKNSRKNTIQDTLIYGISSKILRSKGVLVLSINDQENNTIRLNILDKDTTSIKMPKVGKNIIIGYIPLGSTIGYIFNLPEFTINNFKYIRINDVKKFVSEKSVDGLSKGYVLTKGNELKISRSSPRNDLISKMIEI